MIPWTVLVPTFILWMLFAVMRRVPLIRHIESLGALQPRPSTWTTDREGLFDGDEEFFTNFQRFAL